MKVIAIMNNGNNIAECSPEEVGAYALLVRIAKEGGVDFYDSYPASRILDDDLSLLLGAVSEWVKIKQRANILRNLADDIDRAIKATNDPT